MRTVVYVLLVLLYVLHNDVWYWDDPAIVLGLPVGITYHLFWSLAVSLCFWLAVQYAWPAELEAAATTQPLAAPAERDTAEGKETRSRPAVAESRGSSADAHGSGTKTP